MRSGPHHRRALGQPWHAARWSRSPRPKARRRAKPGARHGRARRTAAFTARSAAARWNGGRSPRRRRCSRGAGASRIRQSPRAGARPVLRRPGDAAGRGLDGRPAGCELCRARRRRLRHCGQMSMGVDRTAEPDARRRTADAADGVLTKHSARPRPLYLFGAGHVGRALVLALAPLPLRGHLDRSAARRLSRAPCRRMSQLASQPQARCSELAERAGAAASSW